MRLSDSNQSLPCSRPHPQVGWTSARVNCTENNVLVVTPGKCVGGRYINFPAGEYETGFSNFDSYHTNIYDTNECVACPAGRWGDQTNADRWVCVYACACVRARTCACVCAHMRVCVCLTGKNTLTVDAKFACPAASPWTWGGPWSVCPSAPRGSTQLWQTWPPYLRMCFSVEPQYCAVKRAISIAMSKWVHPLYLAFL